jgi:hypothetical protein
MEINIVIAGVKQYFEFVDGIKVWVRDEHIEINTRDDGHEVVSEQYDAIKAIAEKE